MTEPLKYMNVVIKIIQLYQGELIGFFKKHSSAQSILEFKEKFDLQLRDLKQIQVNKSVQKNKISQICNELSVFLSAPVRPKNTSQSERTGTRSGLRSQEKMRMRFTGGIKSNIQEQQISELDEIVRSYKIEEAIAPKMRMKWKSFQGNKIKQEEESTIGNNNIDLLSYAIPEIESSIRRLSLQPKSGRKIAEKYDFDTYRTVDTRVVTKKKYVPRLF